MATFPYTGFPDGTPYAVIPLGTTTVNVSSSSALTTALSNAQPGQRIVLANGTYSGSFTVQSKNGTSSSGISIEAASTGGAVFASGSTFTIKDSSYVTLKGLSFPYELGSGNLVQFRGTANRCRVTRCLFGPTSVGSPGSSKSPFVYMGDNTNHIRIDHCELRNKANPGNAILGDGNFSTFQVVKYIRIDHNYIHDIKPEVDNEKEPIRLGVSTMSKTNSYSVIERNVFYACICEPEIVSAKACYIRISGNSFLNSIGGPVYRHGTNGIMSDNYVVDRDASTPVPAQTLGVGGVATPPGAILTTADSTSTLNITTSGTSTNPRVYDGQGHTVKKINIAADWVVVQNFYVRGADNSGIYSIGNGVTIQNNDIAQVNEGGVGDINGITFFGDSTKILYNAIGKSAMLVSGALNGSHTDGIQTWNTPSKRSSSNVTIKGNYITGPTQSDERYIHQGVMSEGKNSTDGGGGGTGTSQNWLVEGNYFRTYGNQCLKFDDIHNVTITKNQFDGACTKIVAKGSLSTGINFASDNTITGSYGSTVGS